MKVHNVMALASLVALSLSAQALAAEGPSTLSIDIPVSKVYGGEPTQLCEWPTTAFLGGCTGTLVHPEVVIYAAHCGTGYNSIHFGDTDSNGFTVFTEFCKTYPGGGPGGGNDWAFCKLQQPVPEISIVPILMGCETSVLQPGQEVTIVGFGNTDSNTFGIKNEVVTTINSVMGNGEISIGGGGKDSCQGDSGGPVYVKLSESLSPSADGSWRVFGITSYGGACGGGGVYSMMHTGMEWFESESGVDLTPCHDADGTWNPGPDCGMFPTEPNLGHSTWADRCAGGPVSSWNSLCGDPFGAEPDSTAPTVWVTYPTAGEEFMTAEGETTVPMTITVDADDGDGWGIKEVRLVINDNEVPNAVDTFPPYEYAVQMPVGQWYIGAVAEDHAGNIGTAETVPIGVNMPAPEPMPSTTSGETTDGETDSGTEGTAGSDSGSDTGVGSDSSGDPSAGPSTGGSASGGDTATAGESGGDDLSGCACATGGRSGWVGLWFVALVPLVRRRRGR